MTARVVPVLLLVLAPLPLLPGVSPLAAQDLRGWVTTNVRFAELRPIGRDTVPRDRVTERPDGSFEFEGRPVFCTAGDVCTRFVPRPAEHAVLGEGELGFTAWGFGVEGLSATVLLRSRTQLDGALGWPRADDHFDALLAYVQLVRGPLRFRVGRQDVLGGLGSSAFDGAEVLAGWGDFRLQAYGGRSLAPGLREPRDEALRGLQDFVVDREALLGGASVRYQRSAGTSLGIRYQREIWSDRSSLISERASLDFRTTDVGSLRIEGSADYDFGVGRVGKARLSVLHALADGRWTVEATGRRYLPYFELSTIWGFFSPVAYHEAELRGTWTPELPLSAWIAAAYRTYGDTHTTVILEPLQDRSRRASLGARWAPAPAWELRGSYTLEWNPGAFLSTADVSARWHPTSALTLTASALTLQQIEEFRLGDGRTFGGGVAAEMTLTDRIRWGAGVTGYRHVEEGSGLDVFDWSQLRGWSRLRVEIGQDPGLRGAR